MSDSQAQSLERLRRLSRLWDDWIRVPVLGWRIGLDAIVGLIPGVGDLAGAVAGCYGLVLAVQAGAGTAILGRMLLNLAIDAAIGAVPLIGDVADIGWKANRRNRELLERWIANPARARRASVVALASVGIGAAALIVGTGWLVVAGLWLVG